MALNMAHGLFISCDNEGIIDVYEDEIWECKSGTLKIDARIFRKRVEADTVEKAVEFSVPEKTRLLQAVYGLKEQTDECGLRTVSSGLSGANAMCDVG